MRDMPEKIQGCIQPLEMEAFKHRIRRMGGGRMIGIMPVTLAKRKMEVVNTTYPYVITLAYRNRRGEIKETSVGWPQAALLNRMTHDELFQEVKRMQEEKGLRYYESPVKEGKSRISRKRLAPLIVWYRECGMTYTWIAYMTGISASLARDIYLKEGKNV